MPWAAWALPRTSPRKICSQLNAAANSTHSAERRSVPTTPPWIRNPTMKPTTTLMNVPQVMRAVSAIDRPSSTAGRGTGSERNRSKSPLSASSATPTAPPANSPLTAARAGMRKSTYATPPVRIAPPKTYRKISRNMMEVTELTTRSCGVRTNWLTVRPA